MGWFSVDGADFICGRKWSGFMDSLGSNSCRALLLAADEGRLSVLALTLLWFLGLPFFEFDLLGLDLTPSLPNS